MRSLTLADFSVTLEKTQNDPKMIKTTTTTTTIFYCALNTKGAEYFKEIVAKIREHSQSEIAKGNRAERLEYKIGTVAEIFSRKG